MSTDTFQDSLFDDPIGLRFRHTREKQRLSVESVAQQVKLPVAILEAQNESRVQKLVPVRFARMLASPFAFLRGSAAVMAADLSTTPVTGMAVGACGDMPVSNFGVFASAERNLIFAINDFDEVHPGPWEWDLKRLAASAAVAVRFMGGDRVAAEGAARAMRSSASSWACVALRSAACALAAPRWRRRAVR